MRGIVMIELDKYDIFRKNKRSLKELSKDNSVPANIQYMTTSEVQAIDFDRVKSIYEDNLGLKGDHASSVDAISQTQDKIIFIEFKNGKMKSEIRKVKEKLRDSVLLFGDIVEKTISYTRENAEFVLVYNEEKNPLPNQLTKGIVQEAPSRTAISKMLAQKGKQEFILYDLERYKKLYFKDIHTYTEEEFEEYARNLL